MVSEDTIRASGRSYAGTTALKIAIRGRERPLTAYGFASAPEIARRKREDASMSAMPAPVTVGESEAGPPAEAAKGKAEERGGANGPA